MKGTPLSGLVNRFDNGRLFPLTKDHRASEDSLQSDSKKGNRILESKGTLRFSDMVGNHYSSFPFKVVGVQDQYQGISFERADRVDNLYHSVPLKVLGDPDQYQGRTV